MADLLQQSYDFSTIGRIANTFDAIMADNDMTLYRPKNNNYLDFLLMLRYGIGEVKTVHNPVHSIFEQDPDRPLMTSNAVANIAGGEYTITLPALEVDAVTGNSYPMINQVWTLVTTGDQFQVVNKPAANTIVLRPLRIAFVAAIAAGAKFWYSDVTVKEGSGSQDTKALYSKKRSFKIQTSRHTDTRTGEFDNVKFWHTTTSDGKAAKYTQDGILDEMNNTHMRDICNRFFYGQEDNNLTQSTSFQTTKGAIPTVNDRGQTVVTGGTIDLADMYAMIAKLETQDPGVKEWTILANGTIATGIEQSLGIANISTGYRVEAGSSEAAGFWGEKGKSMSLHTTLSWSAITLAFKKLNIIRCQALDDPRGAGATGSVYNGQALVIPNSDGPVKSGYGSMGKYIQMIEKPGSFMYTWDHGAKTGNKNDFYGSVVEVVSEYGFKFVYANCMGLFKAA